MKLTTSMHVYVCDGPHCGAGGAVDFIDEPGKKALVNFGGGRRGGLTWVPFKWLRHFTGDAIEGCAVLQERPASDGNGKGDE